MNQVQWSMRSYHVPHGRQAALDIHDGAGSLRITSRLTLGSPGTAPLEPGSHGARGPHAWPPAELGLG